MEDQIQLLQFFLCKEFRQERQDEYTAERIQSNIYVPRFPFSPGPLYAVTCWRKDRRFHKEVIEYAADYGESIRSPHMDIEPVTSSVLFRWHKHLIPAHFVIKQPTTLAIRVILDSRNVFETYVLIEKGP